jgi:hypothetical protein
VLCERGTRSTFSEEEEVVEEPEEEKRKNRNLGLCALVGSRSKRHIHAYQMGMGGPPTPKKKLKKKKKEIDNCQSSRSRYIFPLSLLPSLSLSLWIFSIRKDVFQLSIAELSQTVSSVPPRGETGGQKDSLQREGLIHNGRVVCVFSVFAIAFVWYFKHERGGPVVLGAGDYGFKQRNNHGIGDIADYYLWFSHAAVDGE